jgi:hypothetical protein
MITGVRGIGEIRLVLQGRPLVLLREFEKLFPAPYYENFDNWSFEIRTKEGYSHTVGMSSMPWGDSYRDFWKRWNRFMNLRAFL